MRGSAAALAGIATLLLVGCNAGKHKPQPVPHEIEAWEYGHAEGRKLTTPHYEVYTTITDPVLLATFPGLLERAFEYYEQLVPSDRPPPERMKVYLFATRAQWANFTRQFTGPRASTFLKVRNGGYSENGVSVIQYTAHQVTFPLLAHEGFHQYLHFCVNPAIPAWVNEGLAVTCEGQRWTGSGLDRFDPSYNPARRNQLGEALLRDRLYPLRDLLATNAGNVIQETNAKVATYYAQVWALMLFLTEGENGRYASRFQDLRRALAEPDFEHRMQAESVFSDQAQPLDRGEALFRSFISDNPDELEREYVAFMRKTILGEH